MFTPPGWACPWMRLASMLCATFMKAVELSSGSSALTSGSSGVFFTPIRGAQSVHIHIGIRNFRL